MRAFQLLILISAIIILQGCSAPFVSVNNKEFTSGGLFVDKYYSKFHNGSNVVIKGYVLALGTELLDDKELFALRIGLPGGLRPVIVYAKKSFSTILYSLKRKQKVTITGKTTVISTHSRVDKGVIERQISVIMTKIK